MNIHAENVIVHASQLVNSFSKTKHNESGRWGRSVPCNASVGSLALEDNSEVGGQI